MTDIDIPEEILGKMNSLVSFIRKSVAERDPDSEWQPTFHLYHTKDRLQMLITPFVGDDFEEVQHAKDMARQSVRILALHPEVELIMFTSETWYVGIQGEQELEKFYEEQKAGKWQNLRDHPLAIETMIFVIETPTFSMQGTAKIVREGGRRRIGEIDWSDTKKGNFSGRFADFFGLRRRLEEGGPIGPGL